MMNREPGTELSQALAKIVSGAYALTLNDAQTGPHLVLVSFVQQVGFEPPRLAIALHKERSILPHLSNVDQFLLNVLSTGDTTLLGRLTEASDHAEPLLRELGARENPAGWVIESACAHLTCSVAQRVDIGDHWLYITDVRAGETVKGRNPLVHVRRSGLRY